MEKRTETLTYHDGRTEEFTVYSSNPSIIAEPGKFEGETLATPYFYDLMLNGDGDECGDGWDAFRLEPEDHARFSWLQPDSAWFVLFYSDQGFVDGEEMNQAEFDELLTQQEAECEEE